MHHDQDFRIKNIDILYDIADKLKQTNIYKDIKSKAYIFIDFGDGDEGCLYIDIWTHANEQPIKESTIFRYADLI